MSSNETAPPKRILLIDDDELNARAFAKRLERRGFAVTVRSEVTNVVEYIEKEKFELVLLDILMPGVDGLAILKEIRTHYSRAILPVIMVTVINDSKEIFDAFENGANDYINKPINIDAAAARIRGELSAVEIHTARLRQKTAETVSAMVITFHHEINNPLAIVKYELDTMVKARGEVDLKRCAKMASALDRISACLKSIEEIAETNQISFADYAGSSKMLNIKK